MSTPAASNQFLLIFRHRDDSPDPTPAEMEEIMAKVMGWIRSMNAKGQYAGANRLYDEGRIINGHNGASVHDGPFVEAKEVVGGYIMINARDLDEATAIARNNPLIERIITEVRQVKPLPPL